jgi:ferredoxin/flavodoxin
VRISIVHFSGTGNTAWVVDRLVERLTALGDEVTATSCERAAAADVDPEACDVLGIAFPVHASFAPAPMRDWIAQLRPASGKPLFAVTTAGYAAGDTAWYAVQPLRARGYEPFVLANVLVANNLRLPVLSPVPIPSLEDMGLKLARASLKVERLAGWIHRRERHVEGVGLWGRLLGVSQRLGAEPFKALAFQGFFADESCTRCGWCVAHCPVGNIEMTATDVAFLDRCILCTRCYSFCPTYAIQSTKKTKDTRRFRRYAGPEGKSYAAANPACREAAELASQPPKGPVNRPDGAGSNPILSEGFGKALLPQILPDDPAHV